MAIKVAQVFADAGRADIAVTLVPGVGHIALTLAAAARTAAFAAMQRLDGERIAAR